MEKLQRVYGIKRLAANLQGKAFFIKLFFRDLRESQLNLNILNGKDILNIIGNFVYPLQNEREIDGSLRYLVNKLDSTFFEND